MQLAQEHTSKKRHRRHSKLKLPSQCQLYTFVVFSHLCLSRSAGSSLQLLCGTAVGITEGHLHWFSGHSVLRHGTAVQAQSLTLVKAVSGQRRPLLHRPLAPQCHPIPTLSLTHHSPCCPLTSLPTLPGSLLCCQPEDN